MLCLGVQVWARRLPRPLVIGSYASIAIEIIAMVAYDGIGVFNLTVFEIVAFTLVFAWLIALVAITHGPPDAAADGRRHLVRPRARTAAPPVPGIVERPRTRAAAKHAPPPRAPSRAPHGRARTAAFHDVRRALRRGGEAAEEPPDRAAGRNVEFREPALALS